MVYSIYCITINDTGKSYVGQSKDVEGRWNNHRYDAMRDPTLKTSNKRSAIHNALRKYGCDNALWQVIDECETIEEANELEEFYVAYIQTLAPNGYNLLPGGNNHTPNQETKDKISEKLKVVGSFVGKKGAAHPNFGTTLSEERKANLSEQFSGDGSAGKKINSEIARQIYLDFLEHDEWTTTDLMEHYTLKKGALLNILNKKCWKDATVDLPDVDPLERTRGEKWVRSKINQAIADEIRERYATKQYTQDALGALYGINGSRVCTIVNNKAWVGNAPLLPNQV
jgi:group I intron endonuclease